jgi:hypothetical protein
MRPAFHEHAGFFGYAGPELAIGTAFLFDWVDKNGPSPHIRPRFVSVDILESIAAVHLEVDGWSGSLAGPAVCMSDIFYAAEDSEWLADHSESVSLAFMNSLHWRPGAALVSSVSTGTMSDGNAQRETLESWKQIAAYLKRSERTVRRWESREGLPVHRHGHQSQDTVFAHVDEIDRWMKRRTRPAAPDETTSAEPQDAAAQAVPNRPGAPNRYLAEHDAITRVIDCYIAGGRTGDSEFMRQAFSSRSDDGRVLPGR